MKFDTELTGNVQATRTTPQPVEAAQSIPVVMFWSVVWAFVVLLLFTGGIVVAGALPWLGWPMIGAGLFGVAVLVSWLLFLPKLVHVREKIERRDIDGDGHIGPPPQSTHFELQRGPGQLRFGEVHIDPQLVIEWCRAAANGRSLSIAAWSDRFALQDGTAGRQRYSDFRNWLIGEGFARDRGGNRGLCVCWQNPDAVDFVGQFAELTVADGTPLLDAGVTNAPHTQHTQAGIEKGST